MGSGTTEVACVQAGRQFVGVEDDAVYFEYACRVFSTPMTWSIANGVAPASFDSDTTESSSLVKSFKKIGSRRISLSHEANQLGVFFRVQTLLP